MSCEKIDCQNKDKSCIKCFNYNFYKAPKIKKGLSTKKKGSKVKLDSENSWERLEHDVAKSLNKIPQYLTSHRQIRSGALDWAQGDVWDNYIFIECKERKPIESKGKRSFTINYEWLEKAAKESQTTGKPCFIPFRMKGMKQINVITQWEHISDLICIIKSYELEIIKLKEILNIKEDITKGE